MRKSKVLANFIFLSLLFILFSCSSTKVVTPKLEINIKDYETKNLPVEYLCPENLSWQPLKNGKNNIEGFQIIHHKLKELNVSWTCVKVDLDTQGLELVACPYPDEKGLSPTLRHVKEFAKENDAIIAVNATPWKNKTYPNDAVGIVKIDGVEYFPPVDYYSAITFSLNPLRAHIFDTQTQSEIDNYPYAFGGFFQVLKDGEVLPFSKTRRSRVSIGTNADGSELFFFVISTIFLPDDRNGFTFEECAIVLKQLGCTDAMHFDGGHSSCLVINKKDFQKPLLNRKIPIAIGLKK